MPHTYDMSGTQSVENTPQPSGASVPHASPAPPPNGPAQPIVTQIKLTTQVDVTTGEIKWVWVGMEAERDPHYPASASADRLWETLEALTERYRMRALEAGR